jgi:hypothetical protein
MRSQSGDWATLTNLHDLSWFIAHSSCLKQFEEENFA